MEEKTVVQSLAALAQPFRLRVFRALVIAGANGNTPSVLSEQLAIPATTLSFHLKELTYAGLVSQEREGRNIVYKAAFEQMTQLMSYLLENCCQGGASKACPPIKPLKSKC
jgi:ArsR family transcriptional regulator, arsenate/arsenite/antimonite-responsive transcriptional repressor